MARYPSSRSAFQIAITSSGTWPQAPRSPAWPRLVRPTGTRRSTSARTRGKSVRSEWRSRGGAGIMPQPMSTPTAAGMMMSRVRMALPTHAPLPMWASGMIATRSTPGTAARCRTCFQTSGSIGTPWSHACTSGPPAIGRSTECVALSVWVTAVSFLPGMLQSTCRMLSGLALLAALTQEGTPGAWTSGAAMPTERAEVGAAAVDGRIYVVGAYSGVTNANEAYDPASDSWQTLAPLPGGLNHACAVGTSTTLYVIGGFDPSTGNRPVDFTYAYDPASDSWSARAPMPTARGALACTAVGSSIYAIGGSSPGGDTGANEVYDTATDTWTDAAPMPTPRDHLASASLDGLVHAIGGRSPALGLTGSTHEVYDPLSNAWSTAAPLPTGRSGIGAAVLAGRIHVLGGEAARTFGENEAYDPSTDAWTSFAPMPTPRHGLGVVGFADAIYALAGGTRPGDSRSSVVEIFRGT